MHCFKRQVSCEFQKGKAITQRKFRLQVSKISSVPIFVRNNKIYVNQTEKGNCYKKNVTNEVHDSSEPVMKKELCDREF